LSNWKAWRVPCLAAATSEEENNLAAFSHFVAHRASRTHSRTTQPTRPKASSTCSLTPPSKVSWILDLSGETEPHVLMLISAFSYISVFDWTERKWYSKGRESPRQICSHQLVSPSLRDFICRNPGNSGRARNYLIQNAMI
jgi:hypothetical protein